MDTRYYYKELGESTPIYLSNGHPFKFEWLETSDAWLITELDAAIANQVGGVVRITKEQYEEGVKKKQEAKSGNSSRSYRQELTALNQSFNIPQRGFPVGPVAAVVGGNRPQAAPVELPDPLQVPDPSQFLMPTVGKMP